MEKDTTFQKPGPVLATAPAIVLALIVLLSCGAEKDQGLPAGDGGTDAPIDGPGDAWEDGMPDVPPDPAPDLAADTPIPDVPTDVPVEPCTATEVRADNAIAPVDIVWVIDSSGSMDFENARVQENLNAFSSHIALAGIDHHVILIGDPGYIVVPPPLGTDPARFLHIEDSVDSNAGLQKIVEHYPDFKGFLRPGAVTHFVAVTDDNSDMSDTEFIAAVASWDDPPVAGWTFHSVCAYGTVPILGCWTGAAIGREYMDLVALTGGVLQSVCQTDWSPIFTALETAIAVVTVLPCVYDIPDPPAGETLDPARVNVVFTPSVGLPATIPAVPSAAACGATGWYYDDPVTPTTIYLCPATCTMVQADTHGAINIAFGCDTIMI